MRQIQHLFFDLDHTLWDYDRSARETLLDIYESLDMAANTVSEKEYLTTFHQVNNQLWHLYNHGEIDREYIKKNRFAEIFEKIGVDTTHSAYASSYFLHHCSTKPYLIDDALTTLQYLHEKYQLHIITNGFTDSQNNKLVHSGIADFFEVIVTSESTGAKKPNPEIFYHSMQEANADASNSAMIGDNPRTDIAGAKEVGMSSVLYDPSGNKRSMADVSIQSLIELIKLF